MITITDQNSKYIEENREVEKVDIDFIKCNKTSLEKGNCFKQTNMLEYSIILVSNGTLSANNQRINSGDIYIAKKFSKIKFIAEKETEIIQLTFTVSKNLDLFENSLNILKADLEICEYFEKLYNFRYFNTVFSGVNEAYILLILNFINVTLRSSSFEQTLYKSTFNWIEENVKSYITPQVVAKAMNCTVTHLNRIVRAHSGKSLGDIIAERRITEIKQECKRGLNSSQIAQKLDFSTSELLRKYFHYHTGTSLKKYMIQNSK